MVPNFAQSFYGKLPEEAAIAVLWEKQQKGHCEEEAPFSSVWGTPSRGSIPFSLSPHGLPKSLQRVVQLVQSIGKAVHPSPTTASSGLSLLPWLDVSDLCMTSPNSSPFSTALPSSALLLHCCSVIFETVLWRRDSPIQISAPQDCAHHGFFSYGTEFWSPGN